jgi:hypothetical protein
MKKLVDSSTEENDVMKIIDMDAVTEQAKEHFRLTGREALMNTFRELVVDSQVIIL